MNVIDRIMRRVRHHREARFTPTTAFAPVLRLGTDTNPKAQPLACCGAILFHREGCGVLDQLDAGVTPLGLPRVPRDPWEVA